jgi:uracil-DNA glycosylase family 4
MIVDRDRAARELIAFYHEAGVDAAIGEDPIDRLVEYRAPALEGRDDRPLPQAATVVTPERPLAAHSAAPSFRTRVEPPQAPAAPDAAVMAAREAARRAASLEELRAILDRFEGCALRATATQLVFADGDPSARLMFVGEAPGRDEDIEGLPFVGRSGKLLDRMLAAIGLDRKSVYIANVVPWRPPGNRTPTPQETAICLPFTQRQIELVNPDVLVCLGNPSTQTLLTTKEGITRTRGRWFRYQTGTREIRAMPTFHPAFLLRNAISKRLAWRDFLAIKKTLAAAAT